MRAGIGSFSLAVLIYTLLILLICALLKKDLFIYVDSQKISYVRDFKMNNDIVNNSSVVEKRHNDIAKYGTTIQELSNVTRYRNVTVAIGDHDFSNKENVSACGSMFLQTPQSILQNDPSFIDVSCLTLMYTKDLDDAVFRRAMAFQRKYVPKKITDEEYMKVTKDCKSFQSSHGYHMEPVNAEEMDFPIAFNILTHKDVHQLEFLLRSIYRPQNVYCIHIDDKQPRAFKQAVRSLANCLNNVYIASKLEKVVYAGFSRLQADINCMVDQLNHSVKWKYLLNIAAQSFPLKSNLELVQILKVYNGSNDFEGTYRDRNTWRYEKEFIEVGIGMQNSTVLDTGKTNPPPPNKIEIIKGSAYGIFSREFVKYILTDENAKALLNFSRRTYSPDEHYWSTLHHTYYSPHLHPPGGYSGDPEAKPNHAVWVSWAGQAVCHGMWVRGYCVFGVKDLPSLASKYHFFANKLYYDYQPLVLECLNNWIEYKVHCQPQLNMTYYQTLPFIKKG